MIPIPDEDKSLYDPDHIFDRISMNLIILCVSIDFIYYILSVLFVRMWYEPQPSFLRICRTIGLHYILYGMIVLDVYVYSRTVHYTNNININLRNSNNDTIITTIAMIGIMATSIGLVVIMTYHKLRHTRQYVIEGGPPLPMDALQQQYQQQQQQQQKSRTQEASPPPMIIVITGANAGIGKETVRLLYQILSHSEDATHHRTTTTSSSRTTPIVNTAKILLLCRSMDKGQEAIQDILRQSTDGKPSSTTGITTRNDTTTTTTTTTTPIQQCQLQVIPCDLCSFRSIRNAVDQILKIAHHPAASLSPSTSAASSIMSNDSTKVIHTLINNAGVMMSQLTYTNEDNHETCIQANFLGHFLLSSLLLPYISTSILNVTSSTYQLNVKPLLIQPSDSSHKNYSWNEDDIQCRSNRRKFSLFGQYAITKWCNILHTLYLSKHYSHLLNSSALHPGLVRTDVTRNMPFYLRIPNSIFAIVLQTLQKTPIQGAWNTIHIFAIAAGLYNTPRSSGTNDVDDTATVSTESSPLQRNHELSIQTQTVYDWQNVPNGQYWVNRQPEPIQSRRHYATRIEEQAEAVWDWAVQQVHLTDDELQQLQRLKAKLPSRTVSDSDGADTPTTIAIANHSKVD